MSLNFTFGPTYLSLPDSTKDAIWDRTQSLIFRTMAVGMGTITEANAAEFYSRNLLFTKLFGGLEFTPAEIQIYEGLHTNVSYETPTAWKKRTLESFELDARHTFNRATAMQVSA